ncbi:CcaS protein [Leptolyngbya boryana NIES-2135]|jgi:PAS domain S-box-containing protein|uniref:histidine kinase n=1 Tax=Leptolyngbya boryana NIES-2135 TaxID=1973484 RepID=A0A1Z4JN99_LEPBY|nr:MULTISPECIES: PAS domain S-box protein [Leptolyngbya]BAY58231.1 CcaS protein [Leptolyngbya boryana NIES-2135]MBD2369214.1 PAS domain S-box protein [Leptolyngbya sp. FACHB-161]MBD2375439.1 PAS domain S-box protein [Leptolyngbya sp. FACHB-238]MBD2400013.1 PAS domain S-box protein [Leptolyngbya sp. FACHB-239]MBD2406373.1 PAS domain S-box protein [Leptolyngbya sp. FACHB-402]
MRETDQIQLQQRNAELEVLVAELRSQLQSQSVQELTKTPKAIAPSVSSVEAEFDLDTVRSLRYQITKLEHKIEQLQAEVSRRRREQESLRTSEQRYRSVVEAMHEAVMMLNAEGLIETCNASTEKILECAIDELIDRNILELGWEAIHEDGSAFDLETFPGLITAKTGIPCSEVILGLCKPEKQVTWISINSQPLFQPGQVLPYAVVVSFSDISLRRWIEEERHQLLAREQTARAEAELAREQINRVLQSITDGFVALDRSARFTYVNHAAAQILGKPARDLLGKVLWQEFPDFAETSFGQLYRRAMAEGVPLEIVDYYIPCQGWYSMRAYPAKSGVSLFFRNMTDSVETARERDQAQQALRCALQRLSFHVDNSPFAVIEWDQNLRITRWSREAEALLGWDASEVIGKQFGSWELVVPEDLGTVDRAIAQLLNGQTTRNVCTSRNVSKDGSIVPCEWYNSVLFDSSGELISVLSLILNVRERQQVEDERKAAAAELRESEERFRQLAENIEQIFWMYDVEQRKLIYISPGCQQVLGYDSQSCYEKPLSFWLNRGLPEDIPHLMKVSRQALRGKSAEATFQFQRPDQEKRWLLARAFPVRNQQGKVYRIAGIAEDITEAKHREAERQAQEQRLLLLESVVLNANDAIVITEAEPVEPPGPRIVFVNDAFTRMMGYEKHEVIGKTPRILQGPKTNWTVLKNLRSALKNWQPVITELINYHKDGSEVWIELSIFPVTDQTGHYTYWVGLQREITHRKQAEIEMRKALEKERELSELKSNFVTTVSHEFRTPLSTILSSADMLEFYAGNCSIDKQLEHIQRIQAASLNMKDLLSDILMLERADAKKVKFEPAPLNILSFCENLIDEMRLNDQAQHQIRFEPEADVSEIRGYMDAKLMRQIFTNLLSNALKYSPAESTITFRIRQDQTHVYFEVQDQGIGIPESDQVRLFEAFHRATNVGMISGNGLGLAIVKQSVEIHQGQIQLTSHENQGTMVQVMLPLRPQDTEILD